MGMTGGGRFRIWTTLLVATFCVAGAAFALAGAAAPSSASAFVTEEAECELDCGEEDGGGETEDPCAEISDCIPVESGGGGGGSGGGGGTEPSNGTCGAYRSLWEELVYEIGQLAADADPAWRAALLGDEADAWHELVACYEENNIILG